MRIMGIFKYIHFVCEHTELEALLNKHGLEGWRLHTSDPITSVGPQGSGLLNAFVVMDRYEEEPEEESVSDEEPAQEGIAMRG